MKKVFLKESKTGSKVKLEDFFEDYKKIALGFSGGTDSAFLLWSGIRCGADIRPYFVYSVFQPTFELDDAQQFCRKIGTELHLIEADVLNVPQIRENKPERCYYCKQKMFSAIHSAAEKDGYYFIADGTNASDDYESRPGMKAIAEMGVLSPLRMCGITKTDVRKLSEQAGLFTWNKPSYSCLATRIAPKEEITKEKLQKIEEGEQFLFSMGFSDFRLRTSGNSAKLQVKAEQYEKAFEEIEIIRERLQQFFDEVAIDTKCR